MTLDSTNGKYLNKALALFTFFYLCSLSYTHVRRVVRQISLYCMHITYTHMESIALAHLVQAESYQPATLHSQARV